MKKWMGLLIGVFLLAGMAVGVTYDLWFAQGGNYVGGDVNATVGRADASAFYWKSASGFSKLPSEAMPGFDANTTGTIQFAYSVPDGNCNWYAVVSVSQPTSANTKINVNDLNGTSITLDQNVWFAAKPLNGSETHCKLVWGMGVA